ncbi:MAG: hypothetical protein ACE5R4_18875 [Armatimonadota bacterium]
MRTTVVVLAVLVAFLAGLALGSSITAAKAQVGGPVLTPVARSMIDALEEVKYMPVAAAPGETVYMMDVRNGKIQETR